jgi:hypothetical protein
MNIPNSALAYFVPVSKPHLLIHRIHNGRHGVSSTTRSNDHVRWFKSDAEALNHYRSNGWRILQHPASTYGQRWTAFKKLQPSIR